MDSYLLNLLVQEYEQATSAGVAERDSFDGPVNRLFTTAITSKSLEK